MPLSQIVVVTMKKPELLSPAGSLKNMRYAFAYGADAVYAGQPRYSLRVRNNEFSREHVLAQGIEEAHARGKLFFLASNVAPHNNKVKTYLRDLAEQGVDIVPTVFGEGAAPTSELFEALGVGGLCGRFVGLRGQGDLVGRVVIPGQRVGEDHHG